MIKIKAKKGREMATTQAYRIMKLGKKDSRVSPNVTIRGEDKVSNCVCKRETFVQ